MEYWVIILYQTYLFAVKLSVIVEQEKWPTWPQPRVFSTKPRHGHAVAPFECTHSSPPCPTLSTPQWHCQIWFCYEVSQCICVIGWWRAYLNEWTRLEFWTYRWLDLHTPRAKMPTFLFSTARVFLDLWKWTTKHLWLQLSRKSHGVTWPRCVTWTDLRNLRNSVVISSAHASKELEMELFHNAVTSWVRAWLLLVQVLICFLWLFYMYSNGCTYTRSGATGTKLQHTSFHSICILLACRKLTHRLTSDSLY